MIWGSRTSFVAETTRGWSLSSSDVVVIAIGKIRAYGHPIALLHGLISHFTLLDCVYTMTQAITDHTIILVHYWVLSRQVFILKNILLL